MLSCGGERNLAKGRKGSGFAGTGSLLSVHLGDKAAEVDRGIGRQPVDLVPQSLFADGADLVHGNFSFPARALDLQPATPLRMQDGGERTNHDRIEKLIHLILTDYHHRTHFADFRPHRRIEIGKVDSVSLWKSRHQSRPSATVASRSLQSSWSAAMAR